MTINDFNVSPTIVKPSVGLLRYNSRSVEVHSSQEVYGGTDHCHAQRGRGGESL